MKSQERLTRVLHNRYLNGETIRDLAYATNIQPGTLYARFRRLGLKRHQQTSATTSDIHMDAIKYGMDATAKKYGISKNAIYARFRRQSWTISKRSEMWIAHIHKEYMQPRAVPQKVADKYFKGSKYVMMKQFRRYGFPEFGEKTKRYSQITMLSMLGQKSSKHSLRSVVKREQLHWPTFLATLRHFGIRERN